MFSNLGQGNYSLLALAARVHAKQINKIKGAATRSNKAGAVQGKP